MARPDRVGIDFREAAKEAMAELELADANSTSPASEDVDESEHQIDDQPTVEEEGVLGALIETPEIEEGDQPAWESSFEVDGHGKLTARELADGYLRQADYTQKTQELAEIRKEYEKAIILWKALNDNPTETVQKLVANVRTTGMAFATGANQTLQASDSERDVEKLVEERVRKILSEDPRLRQIETQSALQAVNSAFEKIEQKYNVSLSDRDKQLIVERARHSNTTDLDLVFAGLLQQASLRKAQRDGLKSVSPSKGQRSDGVDPVELEEETPKDFWEAVKQAQRELSLDLL